MSAEARNVYDFETIFPDAIKAVFTANEIKAFTLSDSPDLQRDRPRVEIVFSPGSGQGQFRQLLVNGELCEVETSWKGQFELTLVTKANMEDHKDFLCEVRRIMHTMGARVNGTPPMTRHRIQPFFRDAGTESDWTPQDGAYLSRLKFDIDFSIQDDAWAELAT